MAKACVFLCHQCLQHWWPWWIRWKNLVGTVIRRWRCTTVVDLTTFGDIVSAVCVHDIVVWVSSSKQKHIQCACWCLNIDVGGFMTIVSIILHDRMCRVCVRISITPTYPHFTHSQGVVAFCMQNTGLGWRKWVLIKINSALYSSTYPYSS